MRRLRVPAGSGEPRGVRPYQPGDTRRSVHWPATSHVGSLMVRETERQTDDPIIVDVVLPPDPQQAEAESERVMAALSPYLARGRSVVLATLEPEGRTVRLVRDRVDLGRRLARAVAPAPAPAADGPRCRPVTTDAADGRRHEARLVEAAVTLWQRVVQANRPGPPEHSIHIPGGVGGHRGRRHRRPVGARVSSSAPMAAVRHGGDRGRQRPVLLATPATWPLVKPILAVCAVGGFVWFIATVEPHGHARGHLDRRGAPGGPVRLGAEHPRLRRPGPAGRRLLAGRLGRPDGGGRGPVGRPHPRASTWWPGSAFGLWGLVAMWQSMSGARGHPVAHPGR